MRIEEARRILGLMKEIPLEGNGTILNIGSSTRYFREVMQPHVSTELISPLVELGRRVIHCDIKQAEGVDVVGDILEPGFRDVLRGYDADVLLCCNILEHLKDSRSFSNACAAIMRPGAYLIASVPYSYPYHKDPIDNGLRPTPDEIATLFPGLDLLHGEIVESSTYLQDTFNRKGGVSDLFRNIVKVAVPFYKHKGWYAQAHRLLWLFKPYKVSVVVLHKPAKPERSNSGKPYLEISIRA